MYSKSLTRLYNNFRPASNFSILFFFLLFSKISKRSTAVLMVNLESRCNPRKWNFSLQMPVSRERFVCILDLHLKPLFRNPWYWERVNKGNTKVIIILSQCLVCTYQSKSFHSLIKCLHCRYRVQTLCRNEV